VAGHPPWVQYGEIEPVPPPLWPVTNADNVVKLRQSLPKPAHVFAKSGDFRQVIAIADWRRGAGDQYKISITAVGTIRR
jgi:hypothetical protein